MLCIVEPGDWLGSQHPLPVSRPRMRAHCTHTPGCRRKCHCQLQALRGETQRFKFLWRHRHPDDHLVKTMSRHYNSMTQDGLLSGVTIGVEGRVTPLTLIHTPNLTRVIGQWAEFTAQGWGARPFIFFSQVQTGRAGPPERTGQVAHSRYAARSSVSWRWRKGSTVLSGEPLIRVRGKSSPCRLLLCQGRVGKQESAW